MKNLKLDLSYSNIKQEDIMKYSNQVENIHNELHEKSKDENEFLGWLDLPTDYDKKETEKIKKCAKKIQKDSEILVVIGIGGSYLGARAVIEALTSTFYNLLSKEQRKTPQILYAGNNLNPNYLNDLIDLLRIDDFPYALEELLNNRKNLKDKIASLEAEVENE